MESGGGDVALLVALLALFQLETGVVPAFPFLAFGHGRNKGVVRTEKE